MYYLCTKFHRAAALWKTIFAVRRIPKQAKHLTQVFFSVIRCVRLPQHGAAGRRGGLQLSAHKLQVIFDILLSQYPANGWLFSLFMEKCPSLLHMSEKKCTFAADFFVGIHIFLDRNSFCYANQKRQIPATAHSCVQKKVPFLLRRWGCVKTNWHPLILVFKCVFRLWNVKTKQNPYFPKQGFCQVTFFL